MTASQDRPVPSRWPDGVRRSWPLVLPTFAVGAVFGLLAEPVMGSVAPIVMSAVVFAGGAQFAAPSVLGAGGAAPAAILAGALTNLRFLPTGFAIAPALHGGRVQRVLEGQTVVDASFALAARGDGTFDRSTLLWSTLVQAICWNTGTALGVLGSDVAPDPERFGLDVVLPAFFLTLVAAELRQHGAGGSGGRRGCDARRGPQPGLAGRASRSCGGRCCPARPTPWAVGVMGSPQVWATIAALAVVTFAIKGAGPALLGRRDLPGRVLPVAALLPAALLTELVVVATTTISPGGAAARFDLALLAGLAAAVLALLLRLPLLVVLVAAAGVTAAVRLLT